ncbi:hypothetical protein TWF694_006441 [Orbilia ellipsospora]|uniref:Uncharacterized protein n=1 Tax=Orbilia ellipsospora TaxID=2528407 RepID=A0AAV9XMP0_9PEZI
MKFPSLKPEDYTVGWVTVLDTELNAAKLLLDEEHEPLPSKDNDDNSYILGRIGTHNVAITFAGAYGTNAASRTVSNMLRTFPNIRFGLLVGVGGAAPGPPNIDDPSQDIRLGDIVVGEPKGDHGGVLQYDMGKWESDEDFTIKAYSNKPPDLLLKAVNLLKSDHSFDKGGMDQYIVEAMKKASSFPKLKSCRFPGYDLDRLFKASYKHSGGNGCSSCDFRMVERRSRRESDLEHTPEVHHGLIASTNKIMKSAKYRDNLRDRWDVSCFDMEAAGLMDNFPCLVIRGICDYSDSHKNTIWQPYAAVVAAAYAKDLLRVIRTDEITALPPALTILSLNYLRNGDDIDQRIGAATQKGFDRFRDILEKLETRLSVLDEKVSSLSQSQDVVQKIEARLFTLEEMVTSLNQPSPDIDTAPTPKPFPLKEGAKYHIINAAGGTAIDLSVSRSHVIHGWESHNGENQKWVLGKDNNGQWTLMNCLRPVYFGFTGKFKNGANIMGTDKPYGWDISQDDELPFYFHISRPNNQRPDLHVDLGAGKSENGSNLVLWTRYLASDPRRQQKWIFLPV